MPSHIRMVLTRSSEVVPIVGGRMQLGTWQGIFLFEHRRAAHRRRILVTVMGDVSARLTTNTARPPVATTSR